jgi:hypothetical protein
MESYLNKKLFMCFVLDCFEYLIYLYIRKTNNNINLMNDDIFIDNNLENIVNTFSQISNNKNIIYLLWKKQFQYNKFSEAYYLYKEYYDSNLKTSRMFNILNNSEIRDMNERIKITQNSVNGLNNLNVDITSFLLDNDFNDFEDIRNHFKALYPTVNYPKYDMKFDDLDIDMILHSENENFDVVDSRYWSNDTWKIIEHNMFEIK